MSKGRKKKRNRKERENVGEWGKEKLKRGNVIDRKEGRKRGKKAGRR